MLLQCRDCEVLVKKYRNTINFKNKLRLHFLDLGLEWICQPYKDGLLDWLEEARGRYKIF